MRINCFENAENKSVDVVITSLPWVDTMMPLMAPAALKPVVEKAGLTSLCTDLNVEVFNKGMAHPEIEKIINFFNDGVGHPAINDWLEDLFDSIATAILSWKPKYVGLSLFTYFSRQTCKWLCYYIKKYSPETKIIIGGAGCLEQFTGPGFFADELIEQGLVDYHIRGDGEKALYELLIGNTNYPGINSLTWQQLTNIEIENLPFPDYSNYIFSDYRKHALGIHGSRGCVRECTFCDYIANWEKFTWRSAENIFSEMILQHQKYGIRFFKFHDTLINGNLKEFNKLIELLANWNNKNPDKKLSWGSHYIFRERSANDDEMWKTLAESGVDFLLVGIENLNEDIRYAIGKKFSNESIDYHLEQARKNNVRMDLLFIVGYVSETQAHIDFAKKWLADHVQYKDLVSLSWGGSLSIMPNTYLDRNKEKLGVKMIGDSPNLWINQSIGSTPALRAKWTKELIDESHRLGYQTIDLNNHFIIEKLLNVK